MSLKGRTALHVAAGNHFKINLDVIRLLLENGCKPDDKDKQVQKEKNNVHKCFF